MNRHKKQDKWRKLIKISKLTIFLLLCLIVLNSNMSNKMIAPNAPIIVRTAINNIVTEHTAIASINKEKEPQKSLMERKKDIATEWLYKKTEVLPRRMAVEYVDFITTNVKPDLQPLVTALLTVESGGNAFALSPKGARGVTQIVPKYWGKELIEQGLIKEERDLFDYKCNILSHQYIMNQLLKDTKGNVRRALVYYSGYKDVYADKVLGRMNDLTHHMTMGISPENTSGSSHHKTTKKKR